MKKGHAKYDRGNIDYSENGLAGTWHPDQSPLTSDEAATVSALLDAVTLTASMAFAGSLGAMPVGLWGSRPAWLLYLSHEGPLSSH